MNLVIRAVSLAGAPLSQSITGYFDTRGGTIGRSDTNTMALPDPERHISRLQAEVWFANGSYMVRNVGTANAIMHNDHRIAPGESAVLNSGDELQIGTYVLKVQQVRDNETVRTITRGRVAVEPQTVIASSTGEANTDPRRADLSPRLPAAAPAPRAAAAGAAPAQDPFAGLGIAGGVSAGNPFAALLGDAAASPPAPSPAGRVPPPAAGLQTALAASPPPVSARLPDDFDPFADPVAPPDPAAQLRQAAGGASGQSGASGAKLPDAFDVLGSVGAPSATPSLDTLFDLKAVPSSGADPLAEFLSNKPGPGAAPAAAGSLDPLELLARTPAAAPVPAPARPVADNVSDLSSAFSPPRVTSDARLLTETIPAARLRTPPLPAADRPAPHTPLPLTPMPPPGRPSAPAAARAPAPARPDLPAAPAVGSGGPPAAAAPVAPAPAAGRPPTPEELWSAFREGTGVNFVPPQGLNTDLMRMIGTLLRLCVEGTRSLVAARAATKQELRAEVTIVQPRNNNPLKFAPDAQAALEQLLQPPLRGFLAGPEAVQDVMDDLLGHAIGTMAGMRAALDGVLGRFEPDQLEAKLVGRSVLDALMPMNRRAKLWELYLQHFDSVRADAHDDFHSLFGRAFLQAYEQQLDRLDAERGRS